MLISMVGFSATTPAGELVKLWPGSPPGYQTPPGEEGDKSKPNDHKQLLSNCQTPDVPKLLCKDLDLSLTTKQKNNPKAKN